MIKEAQVIYQTMPSEKKKKRTDRHSYVAETTKALPGMKVPAAISTDGHSISAVIPENIPAFRFLLIDANGFLQYSETISASQ